MCFAYTYVHTCHCLYLCFIEMFCHYGYFVALLVAMYQVVTTASDNFVYERVITVDVNSNSSSCCRHGNCTFNSLEAALDCANLDCEKRTVLVNVVSHNLVLESDVNLSRCSHIKIAGLKYTNLHCENNATVSFVRCSEIVIEGISWDECGIPDISGNYGQLIFQYCSNVEITDCVFENSSGAGVSLVAVDGNIFMHNLFFLHNAGNGNGGGMSLSGLSNAYKYLNVSITNSFFSNNTVSSSCAYQGCSAGLYIYIEDSTLTEVYINVEGTLFNAHNASGSGAVFIQAYNMENVTINVRNMTCVNNFGMLTGVVYINTAAVHSMDLLMDSNNFTGNGGNVVHGVVGASADIKITNTDFYSNKPSSSFEDGALLLELDDSSLTTLDVSSCKFLGNEISLLVVTTCNDLHLSFSNNNFSDNSGQDGIKIIPAIYCSADHTTLRNIPAEYPLTSITSGTMTCTFTNNTFANNSVAHNGMIYISRAARVSITNCQFTNNYAVLSVIYTHVSHVYLDNCNFIANKASGLYMLRGNVTLQGHLKFHKNSASVGGGIVLKTESFAKLDKGVTLEFIDNFALQYGGAVYVELPISTCIGIEVNGTSMATFHNNSAGIAGNSTYFHIPKVCSDSNLTAMVDGLQCQGDNSSNVSEFSCKQHMSSSPTQLSLNNSVSYHVANYSVMLGEELNVHLRLTDYFGHIAEPTVFSVDCIDKCDQGAFRLEGSSSKFTVISDSFQGVSVSGSPVSTSRNVTIKLSTFEVGDLKSIELNFTLQLSPCHSGFVYNKTLEKCKWFTKDGIIHCNTTQGKIKRGFWFGFINKTTNTTVTVPTLSNCPFNYCQFKKCDGNNELCQLKSSLSEQCHHHRKGRACGECATHYSLPYDATECVPSSKCRPIYTVLVVIFTVVYWLVIVAVTFALMSLHFKVSYLFSLIYFYSIVDLLLGNNLYISDGVFSVVTLLSSFAKLLPQFLGKLCLVEGLSVIDQQFIHYIHPLAVLFLLIIIAVIARKSIRISTLISSSVIRVICILLLLSYTSIASTSLQLLRSLDFTGVDGIYVYSSPNIKYFHGRHGFYGSVAVLCELAVGMGLPLILILDPFLSHKINLSRIRPLLDQFQGGYKDKYRYCAAFYLVCRQIIFLIVQFTTVSNHDKMNFVLLVVCSAIAMLHAWIQPYVKEKLNSLDEVVLISAVVIVGINGSTFSSETLAKLIIGFVFFPLLSLAWFILLSLNTFKRLRVLCIRIRVFLRCGSVEDEPVNDTGALDSYDKYDRASEHSDDESQPLIRTSILR